MYSLRVAEGRAILISIINGEEITMKRTTGDSYVLVFSDHQEELEIPRGHIATFGPIDGETFTMDRRYGSWFVINSTRNVLMKIIPKIKKEISNVDGNRKKM